MSTNGSKRYYYQANGVHLNSCMKMPELIPVESLTESITVKIDFGQTPDNLAQVAAKGVRFQAGPNQFLLPIDGIGTFWVKNGMEIIIQPEDGVDESEIRVFLLASAMGALAHQRKQLPLHASAIEFEGRAVLFSGDSGLGKSTLAGTFYKKGYRVITDDIAIIDRDPLANNLKIEAGYAQLKLWEDSLNMLDIEQNKGVLLRHGLKKYGYRLSTEAKLEPLPLQAIYALTMNPGSEHSIKKIDGWEKFRHINHRTFRQKLVEPMGFKEHHYRLLGELCESTSVYLVERPFEKSGFPAFIKSLEEHFNSQAI